MRQLEAELYELTHRGNPGDVAFYANACARAANVLELGVGYGRLIPALTRVARAVVGLEKDASLLLSAKKERRRLSPADQRRVALLRGDMHCFAIDRKFDRILLPYSGLYCLTTRRQMQECFRNVHSHLTLGGKFIFDVWCADRFHARANSRHHRDETSPICSVYHRGQTWDVWEKSRLRRGAQRLDVFYTYISREQGSSVEIPIQQRYAPTRELVEQLGRAGFEVDALYGDFSLTPCRPSSSLAIVCARKSRG